MSLNYTQAAKRLQMICKNMQEIHSTGQNPMHESSPGLCSEFSYWGENRDSGIWREDYLYYDLIKYCIGSRQTVEYLGPEGEYSNKRQAVVRVFTKVSVRTLRRWLSQAKKIRHESNVPCIKAFEFIQYIKE